MTTFNALLAQAIARLPHTWTRRLARRYIAGETLAEAVHCVARLNAAGFLATLDVLGDNAATPASAEATTDEYLRVLGEIERRGLRANISVKPSALGLLLDEAACERNLRRLLAQADRSHNFVRLDMEDARCTQRTIDLFLRLRTAHPGTLGLALQAYLRRTGADIEPLLDAGSNIRLCKGIYAEDPALLVPAASSDRRAINAPFLRLLQRCFATGTYVGIATHDADLVTEARKLADPVDKTRFEFQMLLGVCEPLRDRLRDLGYLVRIYVPYGPAWHGYSMRRIRESPFVAGYLIKALLRR